MNTIPMIAELGDPRLPERFWSKVSVDSGCWLWTASLNTAGYPQYGIAADTPALAHRVSYSTLVGPIPEGFTIDHLCRHPPCVNPAHLEPVTRRVNIQRAHASRRAERQAAA